jgi:hypothetical protein
MPGGSNVLCSRHFLCPDPFAVETLDIKGMRQL